MATQNLFQKAQVKPYKIDFHAKGTLYTKVQRKKSLGQGTIGNTLYTMTEETREIKEGKKYRRRYSTKSVIKECRCKYFFYISYDKNGFDVVPGLGNRFHMYHSPLKRSSRLKNRPDIHKDEEDLISDMIEDNAQDCQIQNIVFNETGKLIQKINHTSSNKDS